MTLLLEAFPPLRYVKQYQSYPKLNPDSPLQFDEVL